PCPEEHAHPQPQARSVHAGQVLAGEPHPVGYQPREQGRYDQQGQEDARYPPPHRAAALYRFWILHIGFWITGPGRVHGSVLSLSQGCVIHSVGPRFSVLSIHPWWKT